jgi:hypothetical protein
MTSQTTLSVTGYFTLSGRRSVSHWHARESMINIFVCFPTTFVLDLS